VRPVVETHTEFWIDESNRLRSFDAQREKMRGSRTERQNPAAQVPGSTYTFDGAISRRLYRTPNSIQGTVWKGDQMKPLSEGQLYPFLLSLRPISCGWTDPSLHHWRLITENAIVDNVHLTKLQSVESDRIDNIWVDPACDDVLVEWEERSRNEVVAVVSIQYEHDPRHGWLPIHWTRSGDPEAGRAASRVSKLTINERFAPGTFTIQFPAGTRVLDKKVLETYVVAEDGSKRNVIKFNSLEALKVYDALDQTVDFALEPQPLSEAVEFLAERYRIKVTIDAEAVGKGLIDPLIEVKTTTAGIQLKAMLSVLLEQSKKPLAFEARKGALVIVPAAHAK
jgi:hypothetical protein